jgi:hypothetical protein
MEFKHPRRLVFAVGGNWKGWFCERCCWSQPAPEPVDKRTAVALTIQAEFDQHSCEEFAAKNWVKPAS